MPGPRVDLTAQILEDHLGSGNGVLRERAAEFLSKTRSVRVVRALRSAMNSHQNFVAVRGSWGLTLVPSAMGLPVLKQALHAPDHRVVAHAAWALGRIADVRARKALISALWSKRRIVRAHAAGGLWRAAVHGFTDRRVERRLQSMLEGDKGHAALTLSHMLRNRHRVRPRGRRIPTVFEREGGAWIR